MANEPIKTFMDEVLELRNEIEQMKGQNSLLVALLHALYKTHREDMYRIYGLECTCLACKKAEQILNPPSNYQGYCALCD